MTTVETERLLLRPLELGDLDAFAPVWADAVVMRHIGSGAPRDRDELGGAADAARRALGRARVRAVGRRPEGRAGAGRLGRADGAVVPALRAAGRGGRLAARPPVVGPGLATEAGAAAIDWGFGGLGLDRLISIIYADNTPSLRVADKLGMTRWATEQHPRSGRELALYERPAPVATPRRDTLRDTSA